MDEPVIKYYRRLVRYGFDNAGSFETPSIFLDSVGEKFRICGHNSSNYLHVYISVAGEQITDAKYLCTCDPTANVAIEAFCVLIKGKTLLEAEALTPEAFTNLVGSSGEDFLKRASGLIELFHKGLERYRHPSPSP